MSTPQAIYNVEENKVDFIGTTAIAWAGLVDRRYKVEVERIEPYKGVLRIYDGNNRDVEIHAEETSIIYDAVFGPDIDDVASWQERACEIIDNPPKASQ